MPIRTESPWISSTVIVTSVPITMLWFVRRVSTSMAGPSMVGRALLYRRTAVPACNRRREARHDVDMDDEGRRASERRLNVLKALIKAQDDLPGLVALVMSSADSTSAETAVARHFGISAEHATGVLDMQVRRMSVQ